MDAVSVVAASLQDEALRYLYLVSLHGSPRALVVALLAVGGGGALAGLVGRVQRRFATRQRVVAAGA
jgi:hypothetical protein